MTYLMREKGEMPFYARESLPSIVERSKGGVPASLGRAKLLQGYDPDEEEEDSRNRDPPQE